MPISGLAEPGGATQVVARLISVRRSVRVKRVTSRSVVIPVTDDRSHSAGNSLVIREVNQR